MKKFSIFRYLKQFSLLIFLLTIVGSVGIYRFGKSRQRYTASVIIQYTNRGAKDGFTPDGNPLNVEEIYSSTMKSNAFSLIFVSPVRSCDSDSTDYLYSPCSTASVYHFFISVIKRLFCCGLREIIPLESLYYISDFHARNNVLNVASYMIKADRFF